MKADTLLKKSNYKIDLGGFKDTEITGMTYNSREVKPGNIFFAIKGYKEDGNKYIRDAMGKGARIIFSETESGNNESSVILKIRDIRKAMAVLSRAFYTDGLNNIKLIGITGTNGKTTTTYLIKHIMEYSGYTAGLIGTIGYKIGSREYDSTLTTPDSVELNKILGQMEKENVNYCVMEVSSVALELDRVYGLNFDCAVFTNLTSEHMDYHKTIENYFYAKKILFDGMSSGSLSVSNKDDDYGQKIVNDSKSRKFYYSIKEESDLRAINEKLTMQGLEFDAVYGQNNFHFKTNLSGRFNIYNILASLSVAINYDIKIDTVIDSLNNFEEVKGRFNKIRLNNGAVAIIDYSHTSDSLKNAIEAAREIINAENKNGRVITIFGCGGDKDKSKRPVMGKFATDLSDFTIVTSDNPRTEDPYEIINEILTGMNQKKEYEIIEDREKAIKRGLEVSGNGDVVLICGKGHENYQEINGVKTHFDDKEVVQKYLHVTGK